MQYKLLCDPRRAAELAAKEAERDALREKVRAEKAREEEEKKARAKETSGRDAEVTRGVPEYCQSVLLPWIWASCALNAVH